MSIPGKEILPTQKHRLIDEAKSSNYPLGEAFKKQVKTIEEQKEKQIEAIPSLDLISKTEELNQLEDMFSKNPLN